MCNKIDWNGRSPSTCNHYILLPEKKRGAVRFHISPWVIFKQHFWQNCEKSVSATCCLKCSMAHIHFNIPQVPCATIADLSNGGKIQTILENNPNSEYETLGQPLRCGEMTDVAWRYLFRRTMVNFKTLRIIWWVNTRKFNNDFLVFQWATSLATRVLALLETARMCHGWAVGNLQKQPPCHVFPNWRSALLIHMWVLRCVREGWVLFNVIWEIWVCLKIGYIPNYSHLIGIMIITIGFKGTQHFQTHPFGVPNLFQSL